MKFKKIPTRQFKKISDRVKKKKDETWVYETKTHNYMINDTLTDWLKLK